MFLFFNYISYLHLNVHGFFLKGRNSCQEKIQKLCAIAEREEQNQKM